MNLNLDKFHYNQIILKQIVWIYCGLFYYIIFLRKGIFLHVLPTLSFCSFIRNKILKNKIKLKFSLKIVILNITISTYSNILWYTFIQFYTIYLYNCILWHTCIQFKLKRKFKRTQLKRKDIYKLEYMVESNSLR